MLAKTKISLVMAKKIEDPGERIMKGMMDLPSLKERIIWGRQILQDIKEIENSLEND